MADPLDQPPGFLQQADRAILRRLARLPYAAGEEAEEAIIEALERVFASGRGRWAGLDGAVLHQGVPLAARTVWQTDDDGTQRPSVELPEGLRLVRLPEPWYVAPATGAMGRLDMDMPAALAAAILKAPAVPHTHAAQVRPKSASASRISPCRLRPS